MVTSREGYARSEVLTSSSSVNIHRDEDTSSHTSPNVRFTTDNNDPSLSINSRREISSSDENTPIRQAESNSRRSYNTSETTLPVPHHPSPPPPAAITNTSSQPTDSSESTKVEPSPPWYKKVAEKYGSITLENKASVARDHLALERTFLAWMRTSLSFASIGVAITQLFRLNSSKNSGNPSSKSFVPSVDVPFSPYLGHTIPAEVLPYLQYMSTPQIQRTPSRALGPTLLDQLLLLTADGSSVEPAAFSTNALDYDATNKLKRVGKPLGATFIGISIIVMLVGFQRYFEAQHWIIRGKFPASRGSISLVAFVAFALILASLVIIVVVSPGSVEA